MTTPATSQDTTGPIRIGLVDDQQLVRAGFRMVIDSQPDLEVVGEAGDGLEALRLAREVPPDLVAVVYPDSLLGSLDIPGLRARLVGTLGPSGELVGQLFDGLVGAATDTLSITIRLDASADRVALVTTVAPKAKTKLAKLVAAQKPADFTQFARLADGPSAYLFAARLTAGPLDVEYPLPGSLDLAALAITGLGFALVFWRRWSVLRTLGACALAGVVIGLATSL